MVELDGLPVDLLDHRDRRVAEALVGLQRASYRVEAEMIGDDAIPPLHSACPPFKAHEPVGATTTSRASSRWWATSLRSRSSGTSVSRACCRRCSSSAVRNAACVR
jgi:hypothetical protein